MRALPGREAAASRLRTGDQGEPCLQPAASARGDLGRRAAGVYRPRARSRQGKLPGVDGKERVGGVMAMANPPRNGEGDRAQRGGGGVPQMRRPEVYAARKLDRKLSLPEILIWQRVTSAQTGRKFRKQQNR